jgi:RHS repeat-associated protein
VARSGVPRSGYRSLSIRTRRTVAGVLVAVPATLLAPLAVLPVASAQAATTASAPTGSTLPANADGMQTSPVTSLAGSTSQPPSAADQAVTDAKAQAKTSGKPVEVQARDSETSVTYAEPDGTMRTDYSAGPVRVSQGGKWVPVDPTLVDTGTAIAPKAVPDAVTFTKGLGAGGGTLATVASGANHLSYSWPGALPAPALAGNTATYANVVPNGDLVLTADTRGFEVSLVLRKAPSTPLVLNLPINAGGLHLAQAANGDLTVTDASGAVVAHAPAPEMYTSARDPHSDEPVRSTPIPSILVTTPSGPALQLRPDQSWLTDSATSYPVVVDPQTNLSDTADDYVDSMYPTQNYGGSTELHVGTYDGGASKDRAYININPAAIKGKDVGIAYMNLYETWSYSCSNAPINLYGSGLVSSTTTWNTQPAIGNQYGSGNFYGGYSGCPSTAGWKTIDISGMAQKWSTNTLTTEGLALTAPDETNDYQWKKFASGNTTNAPFVSVLYNDSTPGANTGLTTKYTDTMVPSMSGTVHNADGSAMTAYFTVKNSAGTVISGAGGSQASVADGAVASFQIPGDQLIANHDYTWSMHTCANGNCSAESAAQAFRVNPLRSVGDLRGHHTYSKSSGQASTVKIDEASGDAQVGVTGFTFNGNAGYTLPVGVRYDSMAVAGNATPASGTGGTGLGWRFSSGPGTSLTITPDKTVEFIDPSGAVHDYCCEPGPNYYRDGNYDADFNKQSDGTYKLVEHASQQTYLFDSSGKLTDQKDRNKNDFHFTYDSGGGLTKIDAEDETGAVVRTLTVTTDGSHRITGVKQTGDSNTPDRTVGFRYNSSGYLDQVTDPAGQTTGIGYDGSGNLTSLTTPGSRQITLAYDSSHRATSLTQKDPAGTDSTSNLVYSNPSVSKQETKLYDPNHPVSSGIATTYDADNTGKITEATDPFGQHTDTSYTPGGAGADQVQSSTSANGEQTNNQYQANGGESLTSSAAPSGTTTYAYGNTGSANKYLPSSNSDPNGVNTNFTYDAPGNQLTSQSSGGSSPAATASVSRNNDGTVKDSTDPKNDAAGLKTTYAYDGFGQLTSVTPPTGNTLGVRHFTYDVLGRQATSTSGNNVTTTNAYDKLDRPTGKSTAGTTNCPSPLSSTTVCYIYDPDGNVTGRTDAAGTMTAAFDGKGQQTSKIQAGGPSSYRFDYGYDAAGNLTSSKETLGATAHTVSYGYNNAELLDRATEGDGTVDLFGYNKDHQRIDTWYAASGTNSSPAYDGTSKWSILAPAGFSGHIALTVVHDKLSEEKTTTLGAGTGGTASDLTYAYTLSSGPCGSVATSKDKDSVTDNQSHNTSYYCRDSQGRLTREDTLNSGGGTVTDYSYGYDADGNRTSGPEGSHTYNSGNQVTSNGASYDADGNQTNPGTLGYNATDQTTSFNGTGAAYADSDQKERTSLGATSYAEGATGTASMTSGAGTTFYDRDPDGTLLAEHGPDGDLNYYFDGHGSVIGLLDHNGAVQATYTSDAWGAHATVAGPNTAAANNNPWRYTSGLLDPGGLYKFGQRYYQANLGNWTQQDSVEALASLDSGNRYAYAGDDPVDRSDASGQFSLGDGLKLAGVAVGIAGIPFSGGASLAFAGASIGLSVGGGIANGDSAGEIAGGAALDAIGVGIGSGVGSVAEEAGSTAGEYAAQTVTAGFSGIDACIDYC